MPSTQPLFKDLNKRASDLLTKEFPSEKSENKVEFKGETSKPLSWEASLVQKGDGSILGTFFPKYKFKEWGTTVSSEIKTNRDFKAEVALEDRLTPGLKTTIAGESKGADLFGTFSAEYKHEVATVTGSVDYGQAAGSTLKGSAVFGKQGFYLGAQAEYFMGTNENTLKELHSVVGYSTDDFDFSVFGKLQQQHQSDANIIGATLFHKTTSDLTMGTEVSFDTANADSKPTLVFGSQYKLDPDATLKGKFDTAGKLGLSYQQKFNKNTKLIISSTIDTNSVGAKGASTFGAHLFFS